MEIKVQKRGGEKKMHTVEDSKHLKGRKKLIWTCLRGVPEERLVRPWGTGNDLPERERKAKGQREAKRGKKR